MAERQKRHCIYPCDSGFQVKITLRGHKKRIVRTFRTREEAERFAQDCRNGNRPPDRALSPRIAMLLDRPRIKSIKRLFDEVDRKRWSGNPNCKKPDNGSRGNEVRFLEWVGPNLSVPEALSEHVIAASSKNGSVCMEIQAARSTGTEPHFLA